MNTILFFPLPLFQDESGAHLELAAAAEDEKLNGVSGSTPSAASHHVAGTKKKRHRIPRQEKDKEPQVSKALS